MEKKLKKPYDAKRQVNEIIAIANRHIKRLEKLDPNAVCVGYNRTNGETNAVVIGWFRDNIKRMERQLVLIEQGVIK